MRDHTLLVLACAALLCLSCSSQGLAAPLQSAGQGQEEAPKKPSDTKESPAAWSGSRSLAEAVSGNLRNQLGFTLGSYETYDSNVFNASGRPQAGTSTMLSSRVFTNIGRRRSQLHLDYGIGFYIFNTKRELDAVQHRGYLSYVRQISRRASLRISDEASSGSNQHEFFLSPLISSMPATPGFSSEINLAYQRMIRNVLTGGVDFGIGRKAHLGVSSSYQIYRYKLQHARDSDAVQIGITYNHQITHWLSLSNSYHTYLNKVDERFRDTRIHRVQVGGFNFRFTSRWQAGVGASVELVDNQGQNRVGEGASARVSRKSESGTISLSYHRGFSTIIGIPGLYKSNSVRAELGQPLTRRINFQLESSYLWNSGYLQAGFLEHFMARTALEFALRSDLLASVHGYFTSQDTRDLAQSGLTWNRYVVFVGLQYVFPRIRK